MNVCRRPASGITLGVALLLSACGGQAAAPSSPSSPAGAVAGPAQSAVAKASAAPSQSAAVSGSAAAAGKAIKLGFSQSAPPFTPFFVAKDNGIFARHGLDVTLQQVNGPAAVPAMLAGEIQLDGVGANELTHAAVAGAPVTSIATIGDLPVFTLMADKKYKSVQDLAGQTIGVTSAGSSTEVTARLFLDHFNMTDKVKISPSGGTTATVYAALTQGVVQAAIMGYDQAAKAEKEGYVKLVDGVQLGVPLNFSLVAVKQSYAKDNPDIMKNFLAAYQEAWNYSGDPANKSTIIPIVSKYIKAPADVTEAGYLPWVPVWQGKKVPTVDPRGVANVTKFADDPKVRDSKPEQFIDDSYLKAIQSSAPAK